MNFQFLLYCFLTTIYGSNIERSEPIPIRKPIFEEPSFSHIKRKPSKKDAHYWLEPKPEVLIPLILDDETEQMETSSTNGPE